MVKHDSDPAEEEATIMPLPEEPAKAEKAVAVAAAPAITPEMKVAAQGGVDAAFAEINKQPRVKVRVPKAFGPQVVIINGARFNVPSNIYVDVPEQVAQILRDSERI